MQSEHPNVIISQNIPISTPLVPFRSSGIVDSGVSTTFGLDSFLRADFPNVFVSKPCVARLVLPIQEDHEQDRRRDTDEDVDEDDDVSEAVP